MTTADPEALVRKILASAVAALTALSLCAGEITCATWNMEWFPSGVANIRKPDTEPARILSAGEAIKKVSPSILFVQEIRDLETCEKLVQASGTNTLKVAVCSEFKDQAGIPVFQQCAILTTYPVLEAAGERWHSYGVVDPPRGYAYALIDVGGDLVACFCVHLKSNLTRKPSDNQMNILKRELAVSQLLERVRKTGDFKGRKVTRFIIAGDFNTNLDDPLFVSEGTLRSALDAGFKDGFEGLAKADRVTHPANGPYPDTTFDYVFHRGFAKREAIRVMPPCVISDHRIVAVTLEP